MKISVQKLPPIANSANVELIAKFKSVEMSDHSLAPASLRERLRFLHDCSTDLATHFKTHGTFDAIKGLGPRTREVLTRILSEGFAAAESYALQTSNILARESLPKSYPDPDRSNSSLIDPIDSTGEGMDPDANGAKARLGITIRRRPGPTRI